MSPEQIVDHLRQCYDNGLSWEEAVKHVSALTGSGDLALLRSQVMGAITDCDDIPCLEDDLAQSLRVLVDKYLHLKRSGEPRLRDCLQRFADLLDGQTEPLHPISWQTELQAAKLALSAPDTPKPERPRPASGE